MKHKLNLQSIRTTEIHRLSDRFFGKGPDGGEIGFTNQSMLVDGQVYYGISGECHFSRVPEEFWEDTIRKMKAGGLNIIAAYVFWNHHEEIEGQFCFEGRRNLRSFIERCGRYGMKVILRIGPYDHGEVRNGGFPDWLYGKPFDVRCSSEGFLAYTRKWYRAIAGQIEGLLYKDGGPIIGVQIENEYMHSASPWEMTTGISNEWVTHGEEGRPYMLALKRIAQEEGIIAPFYTCTGWGGAATPVDEMMPLWGGYAFWPWMFYGGEEGTHPATPEYLYRDNHNNAVPETYNFKPCYEPESLPYACCEMGGGMMSCYHYRFILPFASVDAMANIKIGSGCNLLGYYMYKGGSNPRGLTGEYMNESQCPKISYDYSAPVGEFGQLRPSWFRLRAVHRFLEHFGEALCPMVTVLPENAETIDPADPVPLRYAVRTDGTKGFLFLNNYQDHAQCLPKHREEITLHLADGDVIFPDISIAAEESAILPFGWDLDGLTLICATAQPLSVIRTKAKSTFVFFTPEGMESVYLLAGEEPIPVSGGKNRRILREAFGHTVEILTLTREESLQYEEVTAENGEPIAFLSEEAAVPDGRELRLETTAAEAGRVEPICCGKKRWRIRIPEETAGAKERLLRIDYSGDIGSLFGADGYLLADNFSNEDTWETGLAANHIRPGDELTLYITPRREQVKIDVSSTMAGRHDQSEGAYAELRSVTMAAVRERVIALERETEAIRRQLRQEGLTVLS